MTADREEDFQDAKARQDAQVLQELQAKFDEFVARLNEPGAMDRILRAAPEHNQVFKLGPPR